MKGRAAVEALLEATVLAPEGADGEGGGGRHGAAFEAPGALKRYRGVRARPLDRALRRTTLPATAVLSGAVAEASELDDETLATLLFLSAGITRGLRVAGRPTWFRAAMSAGNLHPVEVYVVRDGVWHYEPLVHALTPVRLPRTSASRTGTGATLVLTGIAARTCWRYGARGFRHLYWDAGSLLANLLAASAAHGIAAEVVCAVDDAAIAELLGIDGVDEAPLALVRLADPEPDLAAPDLAAPAPAHPVAPAGSALPLVVAAQASTALSAGEVEPWRRRAGPVAREAPGIVEGPVSLTAAAPVEDVILRRGASRRFRPVRADQALLEWGLAVAARPADLDVARRATLLSHLVNVHDVSGHAPGAYRFRPFGPGAALLPLAALDVPRRASAEICLGQQKAADAAFVVFHACDLEALLASLGGRAYRVAALEAGIAAGRLALAATALGCGATGLTFYDRQASARLGVTDAILLATAVGVPASPSLPSGSPGEPFILRTIRTR